MADNNDEDEPLIALHSGDFSDVVCLPKIKKFKDGSEEKHERLVSRLRAIEKKYAALGPNHLLKQAFNNEGDHSLGVPGKGTIKVQAFKPATLGSTVHP